MTRLRDLIDTLSLLPDARDDGSTQFLAALLADIDLDTAYVRRTASRRLAQWLPWDDDIETPTDLRREEVGFRRTIDWLAWVRAPRSGGVASISSLQHTYKQMYSDNLPSLAPHPAFASLTPAGRMQAIVEMAQEGVISQDEARELIDPPGDR